MELIGRKKERKELETIYKSGKPELVAIYGRRRARKTFLINQTFLNKLSFRHVALPPSANDKKNKYERTVTRFQIIIITRWFKRKKLQRLGWMLFMN